MTWASISLRKMELKNRINSLESQLIDISQQMQTIASEKGSEQTKISLQKNYRASIFNNQYLTNLGAIQRTDFGLSNMNAEQMAEYQQKYNEGRDAADQRTFDCNDYMLSLAKEEIIGNIRKQHGENSYMGCIELVQNSTSLSGLPYRDHGEWGIDISQYTQGTDGYTDEQLSMLQEGFRQVFPITLEDNGYVGPDGEVFSGVDYDENYWTATAAATIDYNDKNLQLNMETQAQSNALRSETDAQTQALEAQQEQMQAQLKAARAEYENLDQALDNDIQKGAIKLV